MTTKILHFHSYNHIGLTIASQQIPRTNYYVLGMSLAHKDDQGSRFVGRRYALEALNEGLNDTDLDLHLTEMRDSMSKTVLSQFGIPNVVRGQKGHYIVYGLANLKALVRYLRYFEYHNGGSKVNSVFHQTFFKLPEVFKKVQNSDFYD